MWRTPPALAEHYARQQSRPFAVGSYTWPAIIALIYLLPIAHTESAVAIATDGWIGTTWQVAILVGCALALAGSLMGARYLPRSLVLEATGAGIIGANLTAYVVALAIHAPWWSWAWLAAYTACYFWRAVQVMRERGRVVELIAAVRIVVEDRHPEGP